MDRFDPLTLAVVVAILGLCLVDGILTIELLDARCVEINPLMRRLLDLGHHEFLIGKYLLTALGLPFLVVYKNWRLFGTRFRAGYLLPIFLALYLALIVYQLRLFDHAQRAEAAARGPAPAAVAARIAAGPAGPAGDEP